MLRSTGPHPHPPFLLPEAQAGRGWEAGLEGWPQGSRSWREERKAQVGSCLLESSQPTSTGYEAGYEMLLGNNYFLSIFFDFLSHLGGWKAKIH